MKNYCFTLAYNLPSEVEKVTKLLYQLNNREDFEHYIIDLGFPLTMPHTLVKNISEGKRINTIKLLDIAKKYGSGLIQMPNIGVSQNWTQVYKHLKVQDDDILIGCDPDEHPQQFGWVKAMGNVIREGNYALCSLVMDVNITDLANIAYTTQRVANQIVYDMDGIGSWALVGMSGKFLNLIKEVPYLEAAPRYGWIEAGVWEKMAQHKMKWCYLADYHVTHTDFELGDPGTSSLLRKWKNEIIFDVEKGQISFDEWLVKRRR